MSDPLATYLATRGIRMSEDDFAQVVRESVEEVFGSASSPVLPELPEDEIRRLEKAGLDVSPGDWGADHPAVRTAVDFAALVGSALTVAEAASALGVNVTRVRQRLNGVKRTLYGIKRDRGWLLPSFQFSKDALIPGIAAVIEALDPELHPVAVWRWFLLPHTDLVDEGSGDTLSPLQWLSSGFEPSVLVALAADL